MKSPLLLTFAAFFALLPSAARADDAATVRDAFQAVTTAPRLKVHAEVLGQHRPIIFDLTAVKPRLMRIAASGVAYDGDIVMVTDGIRTLHKRGSEAFTKADARQMGFFNDAREGVFTPDLNGLSKWRENDDTISYRGEKVEPGGRTVFVVTVSKTDQRIVSTFLQDYQRFTDTDREETRNTWRISYEYPADLTITMPK